MTGALEVLQFQLSPPRPSSLAPIKFRMETFWYQPTQVLEKWLLKQRIHVGSVVLNAFLISFGMKRVKKCT